MNKTRLALAALALATALPAAQAQQADTGAWLLRARALHLDSRNEDSTPLKLGINNKTFPEVDVSYFFTPNFAAELVLTYPQKQTVHSSTLGADIGTLKHLPPVLTAQYHFTGLPVRPYVGAGVNATFFSSVHLPAGFSIDKRSVGWAANIGVDIPVGNGVLINVDAKKVQLDTDVKSNGVKVGTLKIDPVLFSVGVGYRF